MSYVSMPKWERVTLPSVESVHIMKDPPRSITLRKKERVDIGDVTHIIRENPDLISDNISYYARGVNPMVSIQQGDYAQTSSIQAKNPYRAPMGGNQYRMPLFRLEDREALSRLKRPDTTVRPTIEAPGEVVQMGVKHLDKQTIKASIHPSAVYNVGKMDYAWAGNKILDPIHYALEPHPTDISRESEYAPSVPQNAIKDKPLAAYLGPTFNVAFRANPTADVKQLEMSLKDKLNIAISADVRAPIDLHLEGDQPIKLKDYTWKVVQTNPTNQILLLEPLTPEVHLTPNLPQYAVNTGLVFQHYTQPQVLQPILDGRPIISAFSVPTSPALVDNINTDRHLRQTMERGQGFDTFGGDPTAAEVSDMTPSSGIDPYKASLNRKVYEMYNERIGM